jgi:carbon-monoxide dehydrogenase medium subunit
LYLIEPTHVSVHRVWYRSKAMLAHVDVLIPTSADEALAAFGDGSDMTVIAGGTIVMPDLTARRIRPAKAMLLTRAGLEGITRADGKVTIGAATPLSALEDGDEPLATTARHVGDPEIRAQATVGGNLCAESSADAPRGDLQAALIVLGASVRSGGAGGERTEPIEDFLANGPFVTGFGRLVLDVSYDDAKRKTGYAAAWRPHAHHYTILAVAAAERDGERRLAATGLGPRAVELNPDDPLAGLQPPDDAVASSWYRSQILPKLVERALADLS